MASQNGPNGQSNGASFCEDNQDGAGKRKQSSSSLNINGTEHGQLAENGDGTDPEVEELNAVRTREITLKAIAGTLIQLLKWFKLSRESIPLAETACSSSKSIQTSSNSST